MENIIKIDLRTLRSTKSQLFSHSSKDLTSKKQQLETSKQRVSKVREPATIPQLPEDREEGHDNEEDRKEGPPKRGLQRSRGRN